MSFLTGAITGMTEDKLFVETSFVRLLIDLSPNDMRLDVSTLWKAVEQGTIAGTQTTTTIAQLR
jgi:hypothetical protein